MKKCLTCGRLAENDVNFCSNCGSTEFELTQEEDAEFNALLAQTLEEQEAPAEEELKKTNGDVMAGAVGAVLFALLGGALYFLIYQLGIIAGICGLVIFVLAHFGYGLFAGTRKVPCTAGIVISVLAAVFAIFLAEYLCVSFEIFKANRDWGITFFDAITATPEFLAIEEIRSLVIKDLVFAYGFGALASFGYIKTLTKNK